MTNAAYPHKSHSNTDLMKTNQNTKKESSLCSRIQTGRSRSKSKRKRNLIGSRVSVSSTARFRVICRVSLKVRVGPLSGSFHIVGHVFPSLHTFFYMNVG